MPLLLSGSARQTQQQHVGDIGMYFAIRLMAMGVMVAAILYRLLPLRIAIVVHNVCYKDYITLSGGLHTSGNKVTRLPS